MCKILNTNIFAVTGIADKQNGSGQDLKNREHFNTLSRTS